MYDLIDHGRMVSDRGRTDAYARALQTAVHGGAIVLDIGTGTGIWALLACRFGARKVYATEPSGIIEIARAAALVNGFADRIEFIQAPSDSVDLPEPVDVIVSDVHGVLPISRRGLVSLIDARTRFIRPGGRMIPFSDSLWAALVHPPDDLSRSYFEIWENKYFDVDLTAALPHAARCLTKARLGKTDLVVDPQCWAVINYATADSPNVTGRLSWIVESSVNAEGVLIWFDCETWDGIVFSNSPASDEEHVFGQLFFPFSSRLALQSGDVVELKLRADLVREDYIWRWDTKVTGPDHSLKTDFHQSTLLNGLVSRESLGKSAHSFLPVLNDDGAMDAFVLQRMDGTIALEHIARELYANFPECFPDWYSALTHVAELSVRYSR